MSISIPSSLQSRSKESPQEKAYTSKQDTGVLSAMDPHGDGKYKEEIKQDLVEPVGPSSGKKKLYDFIPIYIPAIEPGLIEENRQEDRFLDFLHARPSNDWFVNHGFVHRNPSQAHPDPVADRSGFRFRVPFARKKIDWGSLFSSFRNWLKSPQNLALFIWLVFVLIGLVMLGLVMIGVLNQAIPSSDRRKKWAEVLNQILNALFTIMSLYQHPMLFHHLVLLWRWREKDRAEVRKVYCKDGLPKPNDRRHMLFVVILFHITCFAQYVMCAFFWAYSRTDRPDGVVNACVVIGTVAPIVAGVYLSKSPLGKRNESETEMAMESQTTPPFRRELSVYNRRVVVTEPEWIGGLFDCWDDPTVFFCSFFCTFCVFGWNMERLGFGNMYVHAFTFLLFCIAPLLIFGVTALNIDDDTIGIIVGGVGVVLCLFGLLYGGVWRTEMRKKFKLPGNPFCCGYAWATDYFQWLFCWSCSLAQEVRTRNFYDMSEDNFYTKATDERGRAVLVPVTLQQEGGYRSNSCPPKIEPLDPERPAQVSVDLSSSDVPLTVERALTYSRVHEMKAPVPPLIQ